MTLKDGDFIELYGDDIGRVEYVQHLGNDLTIVNAARVSFGKKKDILDASDKKLIKYLIKNKHTSTLEHCVITWRFKVPLFVRAQHHRHRTWCLAGDTIITFNRPDRWKAGQHCKQTPWKTNGFSIKEIYRKWQIKQYRNRIQNMLVRVYDEDKKKFSVSTIEDVIYSGKKKVFEIELADGKKLKCSKDHLMLTNEGWQKLETAVGLEVSSNNTASMNKECLILTNGVVPWQSYEWMKNQREQNLDIKGIANNAGCSYHTIRKWLKIHNLQFDSIEVLKKHNKEHGVWNKGKFGYKTNRKPMTEEHLHAIKEARSGPKSNFWKGGITSERGNIARWTTSCAASVHKKFNYTCQKCGQTGGKLQAHHIKSVVKFPAFAYDFDNLISLCKNCHQDIHLHNGDEMRRGLGSFLTSRMSKIKSIRYVGEEDTYDLSIKGPHHNFVANGMVVHNSYNEISRRYTSEGLQFYCPQTFRSQADKNKQASNLDEINPVIFTEDSIHSNHVYETTANEALKEHVMSSLELYESMLEAGIAREQARMVLPQNMYTEFYGTVNLNNAFKFLILRDHSHAQWEIRRVAEAMKEQLRILYPIAMKAFEELVLEKKEHSA